MRAIINVWRKYCRNTDGGSIDSAWESLRKKQSAREFGFLEREIEFTKKKYLSKEVHQM